MHKAIDPPGLARDDNWTIGELARRLGHDWGHPTVEQVWDECRSLSPMHRGMSYARLEEMGGLQWPCPSEDHPGSLFLHGRLWEDTDRGSAGDILGHGVGTAGRRARRGIPDPADDRAALGLL